MVGWSGLYLLGKLGNVLLQGLGLLMLLLLEVSAYQRLLMLRGSRLLLGVLLNGGGSSNMSRLRLCRLDWLRDRVGNDMMRGLLRGRGL